MTAPATVPVLYREILVWTRPRSGEAVCYRCFENLDTGHFHVQSADFMRVNDKDIQEPDRQFLELFVESEPSERSPGYATLREAILAHDNYFKDLK